MAVNDETEAVFKSSRVDPVSGNEVPIGSLPEEVRDDIPAALSEGEMVIAADVVRYYGVKFFEDLRMNAKMGYQEMAATGRIGGEPMDPMEIVEPEDDMMFDASELEVVEAADGALISDQNPLGLDLGNRERSFSKRIPLYSRSDSSASDAGLASDGSDATFTAGILELYEYANADGHTIMITFIDGVPQTPIPEGYTRVDDTPEAVIPADNVQEAVQQQATTPAKEDKPLHEQYPATPVNWQGLSKLELAEMIEDQQSIERDLVATGAALTFGGPAGLMVKGAMFLNEQSIKRELKRRLNDQELSDADRTDYAIMLEEAEKGHATLAKKLIEKIKKAINPEEPEAPATQSYTPETTVDSQAVDDAVAEALAYDPTAKRVNEPSEIETSVLPDIEQSDTDQTTQAFVYKAPEPMAYGSDKFNTAGQGDSPTPLTDAFGSGNIFTNSPPPTAKTQVSPEYLEEAGNAAIQKANATIADRQRKAADAAAAKVDTGTAKVVKQAKDSGASHKEIMDMHREAQRVKNVLENRSKGVTSIGFKEGGLASKKRKKKKK